MNEFEGKGKWNDFKIPPSGTPVSTTFMIADIKKSEQ